MAENNGKRNNRPHENIFATPRDDLISAKLSQITSESLVDAMSVNDVSAHMQINELISVAGKVQLDILSSGRFSERDYKRGNLVVRGYRITSNSTIVLLKSWQNFTFIELLERGTVKFNSPMYAPSIVFVWENAKSSGISKVPIKYRIKLRQPMSKEEIIKFGNLLNLIVGQHISKESKLFKNKDTLKNMFPSIENRQFNKLENYFEDIRS